VPAVLALLVACGGSGTGPADVALSDSPADVVADVAPDAAAPDATADVAADIGADTAASDVPPDAGTGLRPIRSIATQNAGTSTTLDLLALSDVRPTCSEWYSNNLCVATSEADLAARILQQSPDVQMLEEIWKPANCAASDRPAEVNAAPYVCSLPGASQAARLLPAGYAWSCSRDYPDDCIAFRTDAFVPDPPAGGGPACDGTDCTAAMVSLVASCGPAGRLSYLPGTGAAGPTVLVVVHTNAGPDASDKACRGEQLAALQAVLAALPASTALFVAGDFNFDPVEHSGADVDAYKALLAATGLARLPDDGPTHRILGQDLDLVLVRGWDLAAQAACHVQVTDPDREVPMFDHEYVSCR
jgi:hypothetical protein